MKSVSTNAENFSILSQFKEEQRYSNPVYIIQQLTAEEKQQTDGEYSFMSRASKLTNVIFYKYI